MNTQQPSADNALWARVELGTASDQLTYWFNGIYKIVSYRPGEFHAYYMPDHYKNWGDHVAPPPDQGKYGKCWSSFESAEAACTTHALRHQPAKKTEQRATEVVAHYLATHASSSNTGAQR